MTIDQITEEIKNAQKIVILTHESPDGDAIGSSLALYLGLKQAGKDADVIIPEISKIYNFLPGIESIKKESNIEKYDVAIALDCGDIKRLNGWSNYFESAKVKISIDHHISNTMFGDINYVNHVSPATAQILITVLESLGINLTKDICTCLATGIITDTGGFKYPNTTAETFEFMSELIGKGINISNIYRQAFDLISIERFNLNKVALERMEFLEQGKIAFTYITTEDEKATNVKPGEHEGIVNFGQNIEGVEISILLRQTEGGFKVSLRSVSYVNVSDVALMFGGGGHYRASGCIIMSTLEEAKQKIIEEARKHLK